VCPQAIIILGSTNPEGPGKTFRVLPQPVAASAALPPLSREIRKELARKKLPQRGKSGGDPEWAGMFRPTSVSEREVAAHEGKGPVLLWRESKGKGRNKGGGYWGPSLLAPSSQPPLTATYPPTTHSLTYLVPQHALQPVLAGSSQVDGQCGSAILHHHHCLGQQVLTQLHHNLQVAVVTVL
jgi:hypothetical protein